MCSTPAKCSQRSGIGKCGVEAAPAGAGISPEEFVGSVCVSPALYWLPEGFGDKVGAQPGPPRRRSRNLLEHRNFQDYGKAGRGCSPGGGGGVEQLIQSRAGAPPEHRPWGIAGLAPRNGGIGKRTGITFHWDVFPFIQTLNFTKIPLFWQVRRRDQQAHGGRE